MRCITCNPPPIYSVLTYSQSKQHFNSAKSLWRSNTSKATRLLQWRNRTDGSFTTRAAPATVIIAATSPPNSGDLSVLFQTSAVMLFMYWIANFVVPEFVVKDLQRDEENAYSDKDDQNISDNGQGSTSRRTPASRTKRRGIGSTKQW